MNRVEHQNILLMDIREEKLERILQKFPLLIWGTIIKLYVCITHNYTIDYLRLLRRAEYYQSKRSTISKLLYVYSKWRLKKVSAFTGISIPPGVCKEGLTLYHYGSIVVNAHAKIGRNCCIMNNVNIGANKGSSLAPIIGNNVYIGPGAVLFGDSKIADNCYIGANSVVSKSVTEEYSIIAGIPAKVLKTETKNWLEYNLI